MYNLRTVVQSTTNTGILRIHSQPSFLSMHQQKAGGSHMVYTDVFPTTTLQKWHLQEEDLPKLNPVFTSADQVKNGKIRKSLRLCFLKKN